MLCPETLSGQGGEAEVSGSGPEVLVVADGPNFNGMLQELGDPVVDHDKLLQLLFGNQRGRAVYYVCYSGSWGFSSFLDYLTFCHYITRVVAEGDVDPQILHDFRWIWSDQPEPAKWREREIRDLYQQAQTIVLVSGDGHFCGSLRAAQKKGKKVGVVSIPGALHWRYRQFVDEWIDLAEILPQVIDKEKTRRQRNRETVQWRQELDDLWPATGNR